MRKEDKKLFCLHFVMWWRRVVEWLRLLLVPVYPALRAVRRAFPD